MNRAQSLSPLAAALLLSAALGLNACDPGEPVTLRLGGQEGESHFINSKFNSSMVAEGYHTFAHDYDLTTTGAMRWSLTLDRAKSNENLVWHLEVLDRKQERKFRKSCGPLCRKELGDPIGHLETPMHQRGVTQILELTPKGELIDIQVEAKDQTLKSKLEQASESAYRENMALPFLLFPEGPVRPGATWDGGTVKLPLDIMGVITFTRQMKLANITGEGSERTARIEYRTAKFSHAPAKNPEVEFIVTSAEIRGHTLFSLPKKRMVAAIVNMNVVWQIRPPGKSSNEMRIKGEWNIAHTTEEAGRGGS